MFVSDLPNRLWQSMKNHPHIWVLIITLSMFAGGMIGMFAAASIAGEWNDLATVFAVIAGLGLIAGKIGKFTAITASKPSARPDTHGRN